MTITMTCSGAGLWTPRSARTLSSVWICWGLSLSFHAPFRMNLSASCINTATRLGCSPPCQQNDFRNDELPRSMDSGNYCVVDGGHCSHQDVSLGHDKLCRTSKQWRSCRLSVHENGHSGRKHVEQGEQERTQRLQDLVLDKLRWLSRCLAQSSNDAPSLGRQANVSLCKRDSDSQLAGRHFEQHRYILVP